MKIKFLVYQVTIVSYTVLVGFISIWGRDTKKTNHEGWVPIPVLCNIKIAIGLL